MRRSRGGGPRTDSVPEGVDSRRRQAGTGASSATEGRAVGRGDLTPITSRYRTIQISAMAGTMTRKGGSAGKVGNQERREHVQRGSRRWPRRARRPAPWGTALICRRDSRAAPATGQRRPARRGSRSAGCRAGAARVRSSPRRRRRPRRKLSVATCTPSNWKTALRQMMPTASATKTTITRATFLCTCFSSR